MELDLREVVSGKVKKLSLDSTIDLSGEDICCIKPVNISGTIINSADIVKLNATVNAFIVKPCDRCAKEAEKEYVIPINKVLVTESTADRDEYVYIPGSLLNLSELVRSEIVLNLPYLHLCSEDCLGLCPTCGKNLNEGSCDCVK